MIRVCSSPAHRAKPLTDVLQISNGIGHGLRLRTVQHLGQEIDSLQRPTETHAQGGQVTKGTDGAALLLYLAVRAVDLGLYN